MTSMTKLRHMLVSAIALATLAGCSNQDVTAPRLETDIATVYTHLLVKRNELLASPPQQHVQVNANCYRGGKDQPDIGPGKDWRCDLKIADETGPMRDMTYLVIARTSGCWAALVESLAATADNIDVATMVVPSTGKSVPDPLGGFDGCLRA